MTRLDQKYGLVLAFTTFSTLFLGEGVNALRLASSPSSASSHSQGLVHSADSVKVHPAVSDHVQAATQVTISAGRVSAQANDHANRVADLALRAHALNQAVQRNDPHAKDLAEQHLEEVSQLSHEAHVVAMGAGQVAVGSYDALYAARAAHATSSSHIAGSSTSTATAPVRASRDASTSTSAARAAASRDASTSTAVAPVRASRDASTSTAVAPVRASRDASTSTAVAPVRASRDASTSTAVAPVKASRAAHAASGAHVRSNIAAARAASAARMTAQSSSDDDQQAAEQQITQAAQEVPEHPGAAQAARRPAGRDPMPTFGRR